MLAVLSDSSTIISYYICVVLAICQSIAFCIILSRRKIIFKILRNSEISRANTRYFLILGVDNQFCRPSPSKTKSRPTGQLHIKIAATWTTCSTLPYHICNSLAMCQSVPFCRTRSTLLYYI